MELKYCYEIIEEMDKMVSRRIVSSKDNTQARKVEALADVMFAKGFYIDAIDKYNESLCFAKGDQNDPFKLNEIYAKRAFALFRMNLPEECLVSIRLAESKDIPVHLRDKLSKMRTHCEELLKTIPEYSPKFRLELTHPGNNKVPYIADCLHLRTTERFGRHIITKKALKVGDVVMIERPIVAQLLPGMQYKRCSNCTREDKRYALIPCPSCPGVLYCSEVCLKDAWNDHHRYECKISDKLALEGDKSNISMALRSLFLGVSICGGLAELYNFLSDHQETKINAFDLNFNVRDRKMEFLAFHNLQSEDTHLTPTKKMFLIEKTAEWTHLLIKEDVFGKDMDDGHLEFILCTIYRYLISITINGFRNSSQSPPGYHKEPVYISQHLAMALINHSCAPNVQRFQQENQQVLMVVRPISAGSTLYYTYCKGYWSVPRPDRQRYYRNHYGFKCTCEACEKDYPRSEFLPVNSGIQPFEDIDLDVIRSGTADRETTIKLLGSLCEFMQKYDHHYPCSQLLEADTLLDYYCRRLLDTDLWEQREDYFKYCKQ